MTTNADDAHAGIINLATRRKARDDDTAEIERLNEVVNLSIGKMLGSAKQAWAAWERLEELGAMGGEAKP